jgi:hypothetical protein
MVIPSCAAASISDSCSAARITVRARCIPRLAIASNRSRRALINANSAPTKKAFAASRNSAPSSAAVFT